MAVNWYGKVTIWTPLYFCPFLCLRLPNKEQFWESFRNRMYQTAVSVPFRSLRPDVKGMPVLRLVANKAIDVLNKQRLLSLTSVQYQQHVQTTDSAPKRKQYGSLAPVPSSFIPSEGVPTRSISLTSVSYIQIHWSFRNKVSVTRYLIENRPNQTKAWCLWDG